MQYCYIENKYDLLMAISESGAMNRGQSFHNAWRVVYSLVNGEHMGNLDFSGISFLYLKKYISEKIRVYHEILLGFFYWKFAKRILSL